MTIPASWPFSEPPDLAVITVAQVLREGVSILYVTHDEDDGGWQFLSSESFDPTDAMVVGLREMVEHDPSVSMLADLPPGWCAKRTDGESKWERFPRG